MFKLRLGLTVGVRLLLRVVEVTLELPVIDMITADPVVATKANTYNVNKIVELIGLISGCSHRWIDENGHLALSARITIGSESRLNVLIDGSVPFFLTSYFSVPSK